MTAEQTKVDAIASQAPCSGGLRPSIGNDSVLTETPLKVKTALRRLTEIATLTEQIQSEPHLPIVWRSPSFPKVGTARRAVPNLRREAPSPEQVRLQPMRLVTRAWQAAVKSGTPAASGS